MKNLLNLEGKRFGRILVVSRAENNRHNQSQWLCRCDCGKEFVTAGLRMVSGNTRSCGCSRKIHPGNLIHGHTSKNGKRTISRAYTVWARMKQRCDDVNDAGYLYYGGRGITYDPRWKLFENFLADMGEPPVGMSLDRIDNNGPYSKENCRWATRKTQNRNSRHNVLIEYDGEKKLLCQWSEQRGIKYQRLYERIFKLKWPIARALEFEL